MKNAICYFFSFLVEAIILWQYSSNLFSAKRKLLVKCKLSARMSKLLTKNDKTMYFKIFIKKDTTFIIFSCI